MKTQHITKNKKAKENVESALIKLVSPTITSERIDDYILLLNVMVKAGLHNTIDKHIKHHGHHQGLSYGWLATIWLSHILSEGDHRKLHVRDWVGQSKNTLEKITGLEIRDTDFTDDRLTLLLDKLSSDKVWTGIEDDLNTNTIRAYDLETTTVRIDTTTVSGYHKGGEDSLFQYGNSKDDPTLKQVKILLTSLDPLGMPLATEIFSGERADDKLYIGAVDRIHETINQKKLLFIGDCKMSALYTRAHINDLGNSYLTPLSMVGNNRTDANEWIEMAIKKNELESIYKTNDKGENELLAKGCEITRNCLFEENESRSSWNERVLIVKSESYSETLEENLEKRLKKASEELIKLTPKRGRGKRQIESEVKLAEAIEGVLKKHKVEGLLNCEYSHEESSQSKYIGRGRGKNDRPMRDIITVRFQINNIIRNDKEIKKLKEMLGWRIYVTNASCEELTFEKAVMAYRDGWIIERNFHRLKGAPLSLAPMFVKREDQITGLTYLLSMAVRFLTLIEFIVRQNLKRNNEKIAGLHPENPKKSIDNPTTERLLKAFRGINLTIIHLPEPIWHVTPLNSLQSKILDLLGFSSDLYTSLVT